MRVNLDKYGCCGCNACMQKCPKNSIVMKQDTDGFLYPEINESKCVDCGICAKVCPIMAKKSKTEETFPKTYAIKNTSEDVRKRSSSGGVFFLLADTIIKRNGIVFGAAFDKDFSVKHIAVNKSNDIHKLQGSKYVQSEIGYTYIQAENYLKQDIEVLFSGTPCQIEGLLSFLGKKYENLYTVDFICSGVPSPQLFSQNVKEQERKAKSHVSNIKFRDKKYGWQEYIISYDFDSGKKYEVTRFEDPYMRAFRSFYSLRKSCYYCKFKTVSRNSDITLGDLWGIEKLAPQLDDKKGTSLVFVQSEKGKNLLTENKQFLIEKEIICQDAVNCNLAMIKSNKEPNNREEFFLYVSKHSLKKTADKFFPLSRKEKMSFCKDKLVHKLRNK